MKMEFFSNRTILFILCLLKISCCQCWAQAKYQQIQVDSLHTKVLIGFNTFYVPQPSNPHKIVKCEFDISDPEIDTPIDNVSLSSLRSDILPIINILNNVDEGTTIEIVGEYINFDEFEKILMAVTNHHVNELVIRDVNITSEELERVLAILPSSINSLTITDTNIGNEGGRIIARFLHANETLREINLLRNNIGIEERQVIFSECINRVIAFDLQENNQGVKEQEINSFFIARSEIIDKLQRLLPAGADREYLYTTIIKHKNVERLSSNIVDLIVQFMVVQSKIKMYLPLVQRQSAAVTNSSSSASVAVVGGDGCGCGGCVIS